MSLIAQDLTCRRGGRLVFAGLSFALSSGGALLLSGPNGSGKSSLLRVLAWLTPLWRGHVQWLGRDVAADIENWRENFLFLGHQDGVKAALSVRENLHFAGAMLRQDISPRRIDQALERFGLDLLADRPGRYLSAGQKKRLALARLDLVEAPLWFLDEPTASLDDDGRVALERLIEDYRNRGGAVIASSHGALTMADAQSLDLGAAAGDGRRQPDPGEEAAA